MNEIETLPPKQDIRRRIVTLEENIRAFNAAHHLPEPDCPLTHTFAPGMYARQIFIPKDTLIVGKIHKHAHLNMLMKGTVFVASEAGPMLYTAPCTMVSQAGTKRVIYAHDDAIWTTIHLTNETDLDKIEEELIAKSFEEYDALADQDVIQLLPLVQQKEGV